MSDDPAPPGDQPAGAAPMRSVDPRADARAARSALERLPSAAQLLRDSLPPGALDRIERYVALLLEANRRLNLTRIVAPGAVAVDHLLDALAALPLLDAAAPGRLVDLGSGGGVPGIPLAIARAEWRWTLVESTGRKAAALQEMSEALGLTNVEVVAERAETVGRQSAHRERHDIATARACAALPVLVELALPLLRTGGRLVAWKGPLLPEDPELVRGTRAAALVGGGAPRVLPTGFADLGGRTLVAIDKVRSTPARYPRRPGEPARRPLG
jgi:16S rRNA (guanine527-N7)-methyltransferase